MNLTPVSGKAIDRLLLRLSTAPRISASPTHLPLSLPLSFPTPLHTLNIITLLHILTHSLSQPNYSTYFSERLTTPLDTALRGLIGLYLASDETWGASNYLSTKYFKTGGANEEKIVEFFGVEMMREREHETMKGITVGERWEPGVRVCEELIRVFERLGNLGGLCVGEGVKGLTEKCKGESMGTNTDEGSEGWIEGLARIFCEQAVEILPFMRNSSTSHISVPPAPLRLLQDLAYRQSETCDLDLDLPTPQQLANIFPLPLALAPLLYLGIIQCDDALKKEEEQLSILLEAWGSNELDIMNAETTPKPTQRTTRRIVKVKQGTLDKLVASSLSAGRDLRDAARTAKGEMAINTFLDIYRLIQLLDTNMDKLGLGMTLQVE